MIRNVAILIVLAALASACASTEEPAPEPAPVTRAAPPPPAPEPAPAPAAPAQMVSEPVVVVLPDTASNAPTLALAGFSAIALAGVVGVVRRRLL
jgi:LPXTG-motif cell wall-anchored protein